MKLIKDPKIKHQIKLTSWAIFAVLVGALTVSVFTLTFEKIKGSKIFESSNNAAAVIQVIPADKAENTPKYSYFKKDTNNQPKVAAKAFLVGDLNTGEVILSKNEEEKFPIASTTKLMTALITTELNKEDNITKISKTALATEGQNGELRLGQKIKTSELLYPLLLESSNDAAEALAETFGREDFIAKMNQMAEKLNMMSTSYQDPSGLTSKNQSTPLDMFKLAGYLTKQYPDLIKITTERSYSNKKQSWSNISQFLNKDGYLGGKSGYTSAAKQTVVSLFNLPLGQNISRPVAITLLQSPDRKKDVEEILKYLKKNVYYGGEADANTNWVKEKLGIPEVKDPDFLTLTFVGDIMLDRGVRNSVIRNFNNDYSLLFEKSKDLSNIFKKSDIVFANLEGTASDQGVDQKNLYSFRMDPSVIPALKSVGMIVLSVANNHMADWGRAAYIDTLARLKENEILYTGGGNEKTEAETPAIIEKYGMKIGFLGFTDKGPDFMKADENKAGVLLASDPRFDEIIKNAAGQVDHLIVSFHFGEEYQDKHNARQELLAHKAIDDGAKIIIGHHPHVPEDFEVYSPKDCTQSSCMGYIAYSLGNFVFDQSWSKPTMKGLLLEIKLNRDGSMSVTKNGTEQNSAFQIEKLIKGKEEKIKFPKPAEALLPQS